MPTGLDKPEYLSRKDAVLHPWAGQRFSQHKVRKKVALGWATGSPTPPPKRNLRRLLDEFGKGLTIPVLPEGFSRAYIYDDHD